MVLYILGFCRGYGAGLGISIGAIDQARHELGLQAVHRLLYAEELVFVFFDVIISISTEGE